MLKFNLGDGLRQKQKVLGIVWNNGGPILCFD